MQKQIIQQKSNIVEKMLSNSINNAMTNKGSNGRILLGKANDYVVNTIKGLFGIDVTNRNHVLSDNNIRHMLNEHGDPVREKQRGQIAITKRDIMNIPNIIKNPDNIVRGTYNKNSGTIRYIKNYTDNISYVVEVIPTTGTSLEIKTMWKRPSGLANSLAPSLTSETQTSVTSSTSDKNIP